MRLPIYDVTPFTMLDFPGKTACIIWFSGCNMRCGYCHNPEIVRSKGRKDIDQVTAFLQKRKGLLDGVVLSGGEATLYHDIIPFARNLKSQGYDVKLDTNGTRRDIISKMLEEKLIDYVALDYKAPKSSYKDVTGSKLFAKFSEGLDLLCRQTAVPFEVRTTVHTDLLDEAAISEIMEDLCDRKYSGVYYIQNYINTGLPVLGHLTPQKKKLNINSLPIPEGFTVEFRNF